MKGISICIEDYCEGCPHFEAEQETVTAYANNEVVSFEHRIFCKSREKCAIFSEFHKRQNIIQKKEKEDGIRENQD